MLDVDLKQSQQKLEHLIENKDRMEDDKKNSSENIHLIKEKIIIMTKNQYKFQHGGDLIITHIYAVFTAIKSEIKNGSGLDLKLEFATKGQRD